MSYDMQALNEIDSHYQEGVCKYAAVYLCSCLNAAFLCTSEDLCVGGGGARKKHNNAKHEGPKPLILKNFQQKMHIEGHSGHIHSMRKL